MKNKITLVLLLFACLIVGCTDKNEDEDIKVSMQYIGLDIKHEDTFTTLAIDTTIEENTVYVTYDEHFLKRKYGDQEEIPELFEYSLEEVIDDEEQIIIVTEEKTFEFEKKSDSVATYLDDGDDYQYAIERTKK